MFFDFSRSLFWMWWECYAYAGPVLNFLNPAQYCSTKSVQFLFFCYCLAIVLTMFIFFFYFYGTLKRFQITVSRSHIHYRISNFSPFHFYRRSGIVQFSNHIDSELFNVLFHPIRMDLIRFFSQTDTVANNEDKSPVKQSRRDNGPIKRQLCGRVIKIIKQELHKQQARKK